MEDIPLITSIGTYKKDVFDKLMQKYSEVKRIFENGKMKYQTCINDNEYQTFFEADCEVIAEFVVFQSSDNESGITFEWEWMNDNINEKVPDKYKGKKKYNDIKMLELMKNLLYTIYDQIDTIEHKDSTFLCVGLKNIKMYELEYAINFLLDEKNT